MTWQRRCQANVFDTGPHVKRYFQMFKVDDHDLIALVLCCLCFDSAVNCFLIADGRLWSGDQLMWSLFPQATLIKQHH